MIDRKSKVGSWIGQAAARPVLWVSLGAIFAVLVGVVAVWVVTGQAESASGTINVAGRQRALIERHFKELLLETSGDESHADETWAELMESLGALASGGELTQGGERRFLEPLTGGAGAALQRLQGSFRRYEPVVAAYRAAAGEPDRRRAAVVALRAASDELFRAATRVVEQVEEHARESSAQVLRVTAIGAAIIILGILLTARRFAAANAHAAEAEAEAAEAKEAFEFSHARMSSIIDGAVDAILVIDEAGDIVSANAATTRMFGYTTEELMGENIKMLAAEPHRARHDDYLRHYLATGERKIIGRGREVLGQRKDGSTFPLHLSVSEAHAGGRRLFTGIVRDITELDTARHGVEAVLEETRARVVALLEVVERAAQGDLSVEPPVWSGDVGLGGLARGLGDMVSSLRTLVGAVQRSGVAVAGAVNDLTATSRQQEASASEQAATATEIAATTEEISAATHVLADTVAQVNDAVDDTAGLAWSGQQNLRSMEQAMERLAEAGQSIAQRLGVLSEKATAIHDIVATIARVADQTNLLSLNAAIEAEKAGEYGRGFSVVATEIRRLADQTAVSTLTIEQTVREMQGAVDAGVMSMEKFDDQMRRSMEDVKNTSEQLGTISDRVRALGPQFSNVNDSMRAQSAAADQIREAVTQLRDVARMTADSLRESGVSLGRLNDAAQDMQSGVSRFHLSS